VCDDSIPVYRVTATVDYDLDQVRREWIGKVVATSSGRYPVEYDPIRRYCHMVGDSNPLFLDPELARKGPHGEVIVPLPLVAYFAGNGPWPRRSTSPTTTGGFTYGVPTPGDRGINMSTALEYVEPVRVGDHLRAQVLVADIFVKPIRIDAMAVWIVTETRISNQRDVLVVLANNTVLVHRSFPRNPVSANDEYQ
jgi:acyl dehydratase